MPSTSSSPQPSSFSCCTSSRIRQRVVVASSILALAAAAASVTSTQAFVLPVNQTPMPGSTSTSRPRHSSPFLLRHHAATPSKRTIRMMATTVSKTSSSSTASNPQDDDVVRPIPTRHDTETGRDPMRVKIFDTTLRDGEQSPGCTMTAEEKVQVYIKCAVTLSPSLLLLT